MTLIWFTLEAERTIARTKTDQAGHFEFDLEKLRRLSAEARERGRLVLRLDGSSFVMPERSWRLPRAESEPFAPNLKCHITRVAMIRGEVETRVGLGPAELMGRRPNAQPRDVSWWKSADVWHGRVRVAISRPDAYEFAVRLHGRGVSRACAVSVVEQRIHDLGRLELEPGGVIAGRVENRDGIPIAGVSVRAKRMRSEDERVTRERPWFEESTVSTDGRGLFRLAGLVPDGRYTLAIVGAHDAQTVVATTGSENVTLPFLDRYLRLAAVDRNGAPTQAYKVGIVVWSPEQAEQAVRTFATAAFPPVLATARRIRGMAVPRPLPYGLVPEDQSLRTVIVPDGSVALVHVDYEGYEPWDELVDLRAMSPTKPIRVPLAEVLRPSRTRVDVVQGLEPVKGQFALTVGSIRHGYRGVYSALRRSGESLGALAPGAYRLRIEPWRHREFEPFTRDVVLEAGEHRMTLRVDE